MTAQLTLPLDLDPAPAPAGDRRCLWCSRRLPVGARPAVRFCRPACRKRFWAHHADEPVRGRPVETVSGGRWV